MSLEQRLVINSNAFFTRKTKSPIIVDEYEKMFQRDLLQQKSRYRLQSVTTYKQ